MAVELNRTKDNPWQLKTPPGTSAYTMHVDEKDGKRILVCTVGSTVLHYDARCIDDTASLPAVRSRCNGAAARSSSASCRSGRPDVNPLA